MFLAVELYVNRPGKIGTGDSKYEQTTDIGVVYNFWGWTKQMPKLQGTDEVIHPVGSNNRASSVTARSYGLHPLRSSDRGHRWG
jgi:hypothetical protein